MIVRKLTSDGIDDEDATWGSEGLKVERRGELKKFRKGRRKGYERIVERVINIAAHWKSL